MGNKDQVLEQLESLLKGEVESLLEWAKTENGDIKAYAEAIAKDTVRAIKSGYKDAGKELLNQTLVLAEISRVRLSREMRGRIRLLISSAIKIASTLL
jgi:hypothetical protein